MSIFEDMMVMVSLILALGLAQALRVRNRYEPNALRDTRIMDRPEHHDDPADVVGVLGLE